MHELSLAQGLVDILREAAQAQSFTSVKVVHLKLGALAQVEAEALKFGFEVATRGTVAEGARLELHPVKGTARCMGCGQDVEVLSRADDCPACGSGQLLVTGGDELRVTELEVG